jgi:hypothetical protein
MATASSETNLETLIDKAEIERLLFDYAFHLDMNHPAELAALFIDDCSVSYGPNFGADGIEAYKETLKGIGSYFEATSHHVSNIAVDFVSKDEADVRAVVLAWHRYRRERPDGWLWGQYHDRVVRHDGKWKFKRRVLRTTAVKDFHVKESNPIGRG